MERHTQTCQLLYAELLQRCLQGGAVVEGRGISFASKNVGGNRYWYLELTVGNQRKQYSLGPDTPEVREKIEQQKALTNQSKPTLAKRKTLVASLAKAGAVTPRAADARLIEVLAQAGIFLAGGVLIGSHAFALYSNMLGWKFMGEALRTDDIDRGSNLSLVVAQDSKPFGQAILDSGMGFFGVPALDRKQPSTMFKIHGKELTVELLTPLIGKPSGQPIYLKNMKAFAEPLRYLDYLLADVQPAVVVSKSGILVNVPDPARFAFHKLVVAERRSPAFQSKAHKDRLQAGTLFDVLLEDREGDILLAWQATKTMSDDFQTRLQTGTKKMEASVQERLQELLE